MEKMNGSSTNEDTIKQNNGENKDDRIEELARKLRMSMLVVLIFFFYALLAVLSTTDMMLLRKGVIALPIIQASVPVVAFYLIAPLVLVLVHLHLLAKLILNARRIYYSCDSKQTPNEAHGWFHKGLIILFSFEQKRLISEMKNENLRGLFVRVVFLIIFVAVPLLILLILQARFLAYQDEWITLYHQSLVTLDLVSQFVFMRSFYKLFRVEKEPPCVPLRVILAGLAFIVLPFLFVWTFVWAVALTPDGYIEKTIEFDLQQSIARCFFLDWWKEGGGGEGKDNLFSCPIVKGERFINIQGKVITLQDTQPEIIGAIIQAGGNFTPEIPCEYTGGMLVLSGRRLNYANFSDSVFECVEMESTQLIRSNLARAKLNGISLQKADLRGADLRNVKLSTANLIEANLSKANLRGAVLSSANLRGANLFGANLVEANLSDANLFGANLRDAKLFGANLFKANLFKANLGDASLANANLRGAELTDANLSGADLSGADLSGADLSTAILIRANLSWANLSGADLSGADLGGADLGDANLVDANLSGANLSGANLSGADLSRSYLIEADLRDADLIGADLISASLGGANLSKAVLSRADLRGADLRDADLIGADLISASLGGANLSKAVLSRADLRGADLRGADLRGADLIEADLREADLSGADLSGADLRWTRLTGAKLIEVDLSGSDLSRAEMYGARLYEAQLHGATLEGAKLYGANFSGSTPRVTNFRDVDVDKPENWVDILKTIKLLLESKGYSKGDVDARLAEIEQNAASPLGYVPPTGTDHCGLYAGEPEWDLPPECTEVKTH